MGAEGEETHWAKGGEAPRHLEPYQQQEQEPLTFDYATTPIKSCANLDMDSRNSKLSGHRHQRQQSVPIITARRPNSLSLSPTRGHVRQHSQGGMPLMGEGRDGRGGGENSPGRLAGWRSSDTSTPPTHLTAPLSHRTRTITPDTTPKSSRFSFLASSVSAITSRMTASPTPQTNTPRQMGFDPEDELCTLDIEAVLFPSSSSPFTLDNGGSDTFSPAAYKNLQTHATGLLHKMQDAYRRQTAALREMQAEREEMEERTRHLKIQLEIMAAKSAEQDREMKRAEVDEKKTSLPADEENTVVGLLNVDLCVDDDDGDERRRWRASRSTVKSSDSSITVTTDGYSVTEEEESASSSSIFSRSRSPAVTCATTVTSAADHESMMDMLPSPSLSLPGHTGLLQPKTSTPKQMTAFQRLVKGISSSSSSDQEHDGCRNCRGQHASVAWDTVSLLRDENMALKQRVAHLEVVVEGALDVVNGIRI